MAVIKRKTRKKLSKQLKKVVKKHGTEVTLSLVSGIVSGLSTDEGKKRRGTRTGMDAPEVVELPGRAAAARKRSNL